MGKVIFTPEDCQKAVVKYRGRLLKLPLVAIEDSLRYLSLLIGIQGSEVVGGMSAKAQLAPYKPNRKSDADLNVKLREIVTQFGSCNADFEPNSAITTILGHRASQASGKDLATTPTALDVLSMVAMSIGEDLGMALWMGERDPEGDTTYSLFDGFDTITKAEIAAGNISTAAGNYVELPEAITKANAVDLIKDVLFSLPQTLRRQDCLLYCSQEIADLYNESYLLSHSGLIYNDKYEQVSVEGSNKRLTIVPMPGKEGSDFIHIAPRSNMLVGVDQLSDKERVNVGNFAPDTLTLMLRMFMGVQIQSLDKSQLCVVKLKKD